MRKETKRKRGGDCEVDLVASRISGVGTTQSPSVNFAFQRKAKTGAAAPLLSSRPLGADTSLTNWFACLCDELASFSDARRRDDSAGEVEDHAAAMQVLRERMVKRKMHRVSLLRGLLSPRPLTLQPSPETPAVRDGHPKVSRG